MVTKRELEAQYAIEREHAVVYLENTRKSTQNLQELADFSGFHITEEFSVAATPNTQGRYYEMSDGTIQWRDDAYVQRDKEVAATNELFLQHLERYHDYHLWVDGVPVSDLNILGEVIRLALRPNRLYGQVTAAYLGRLLRLYPYKMPVVYYEVDEHLTPYELCTSFNVDDTQKRSFLTSAGYA